LSAKFTKGLNAFVHEVKHLRNTLTYLLKQLELQNKMTTSYQAV